MFRLLRSKEGRDYLLTFITEFTVLLAGVLVYKFAAADLGKGGFSEYAIARRTISFIQPLLIIGLGVGVPRYIAFAAVGHSTNKAGSYLLSGMFIIIGITIPSLLVLNLFSSSFSFLIFGTETFAYVIPYISMMLIGMVLHSICYGFFRGSVKMLQANFMQIVNIGIIPMTAFIFFKDLTGVLLFTGLAWSVISILFFLFILSSINWERSEFKTCIKELIIYGAQRMPGDVALTGLLALPAYFTAHLVNDNLITAGYVAFGMSLLNMAGAAFGPICLMLLPKASQVIVNKDFSTLKKYTRIISAWTIGLSLFGLLIVELFAEPLISLYLGKGFSDPALVLSTRIILFACVGYTLYISLRSILDAYYVKAVNTKNIFISFLIFLGGAGIIQHRGYGYIYMLYCFVGAMTVLGALTYYETMKIIRKQKEL